MTLRFTKASRQVLLINLALLLGNSIAYACHSPFDESTATPIDSQQAISDFNTSLLAADAPSKLSDTNSTIEAIRCYLGKQQGSDWSAIGASLESLGIALLQAVNAEQRRTAISAINAQVNRDAGTAYLVLPNKQQTVEINLLGSILNPSCSKRPSTNCGTALSLAKNLWWIAGFYRQLADNYNQQDRADSLTFNQQLNEQWRSYKDDTILLWPQEVLLNSLTFNPEERGLSAPPSYKLLALRPSLGLTYLSDQSHHIQPTINLDLLGIYWWKYAGTQAKAGRGISTSLVWDGDETALGLTYHHNPKWSLTLANSNEDDVVISISFQLASWLLKR